MSGSLFPPFYISYHSLHLVTSAEVSEPWLSVTHRVTISSVASSLLCLFLMSLHFPIHTQFQNYCPVTEITSCHSLNKKLRYGLELYIAHQSVKNTGALQRTLVQFLAPIWWLMSGFNSSSKGSIPLFWSPQTLHTHGALTYIHTDKAPYI